MSGRGGGGRGEYYRNKYGGGGGRGRRGGGGQQGSGRGRGGNGGGYYSQTPGGGSYADLRRLLLSIDGKQYPCYHSLETNGSKGSSWMHESFSLEIGRAQSDPFAPPTRCRIVVPRSPILQHQLASLAESKLRRIATADYLWRHVFATCQAMGTDQNLGQQQQDGATGWKGPKGGALRVMKPTQYVLEQSAVTITDDGRIVLQLTIYLPARGRTIMGDAAFQILGAIVPQVVDRCFYDEAAIDTNALWRHVDEIEDQAWLQGQLQTEGLVAFVRNGAILPRASGVDDRPLTSSSVVPFVSPPSLERSFQLPKSGATITGMGIPQGITLICGGGYHGKSTLLQALQAGVYLKVPGDGREFCATSPQAVKIRAEDGRSVASVDISSFLRNLPGDVDTTCFSTPDASGSTSQASNIVEAIELGTDALLLDEDTCATNFMIRDEQMMKLVACEKEPITPFVRVVSSLYNEHSISTILVVGGTGDFFRVADHVLVLDSYKVQDATERAKEIARHHTTNGAPASASFAQPTHPRRVNAQQFAPNGKVKVLARNVIAYGETEVDLGAQEQIVAEGQTMAICCALQRLPPEQKTLSDTVQALEQLLNQEDSTTLDEILAPGQFHGGLVRPRRFELGAAMNRLRRKNCIQ